MVRLVKIFPYWFWIVGAAVVWAIVLLVAWKLNRADRFHNVLIFFVGFWVGVLGASIARKVYK